MSGRKFDVTYEASAEASKAAVWPMHDIRFYDSSLDGLLSVTTHLPGERAKSAQTRLNIGQVIDLYEYLEEFIEDYFDEHPLQGNGLLPVPEYGPDLLSKRLPIPVSPVPLLIEGPRADRGVNVW